MGVDMEVGGRGEKRLVWQLRVFEYATAVEHAIWKGVAKC